VGHCNEPVQFKSTDIISLYNIYTRYIVYKKYDSEHKRSVTANFCIKQFITCINYNNMLENFQGLLWSNRTRV